MNAYYNEFDPYAAQWLRNLVAAGHIADGVVDERSIVDVQPDDLREFAQCHFFAGIGGWSYGARLAGWADDRPLWTGSCPCQPFSVAGAKAGTEDARHLWPEWFRLIRECRPGVVFGEQVEAAIRHGWLDLVQADMEGIGYAVGAGVLPAAGFGAPHIRQRLWFVADAVPAGRADWGGVVGVVGHAKRSGPERHAGDGDRGHGREETPRSAAEAGAPGRLGDASCDRTREYAGKLPSDESEHEIGTALRGDASKHSGTVGGMADSDCAGRAELRGRELLNSERQARGDDPDGRGPTGGIWRDAEWIPCRDGKARPVEPGTFPLAHGIPNRVGRLRAYGNAIVPQVAAEVIRAYMECRP